MSTEPNPPWYFDAMNAMADELAHHPRVEITHLSVRRRFTKSGKTTFAAALANAKREPKALREVLAALRDFTLRWELRTPGDTRKKPKPKTSMTPFDLERPAAGLVSIVPSAVLPPPRELVVMDFHTDDRALAIGGRSYPERTFRESLRFFDRAQYTTVEWVTPPGGPDGLVLGLDAHADYATRIVGVDDYLRIVLASRGVPSLKKAMFLGEAPIPETPPPLDEVLAQLDGHAT